MKVYRISKTWRIIIYSICSFTSLFYGIFGIILLLPAELAPFQNNEEPLVNNLLAVLFLFVVPCMVFLIFKTYKTRIVITQDSFQLIGVFKKKELKFKDIKGFEVSTNPKLNLQKFLGVESKTKGEKAIVVSNLFEKFDEIRSQLSFKVADLNAEKIKVIEEKITQEKNEILKNTNFGFTIEEREDKLKKAQLFAKLLNGVTAVVIAWLFFYPRPYKYLVITCVCLPLIGLLTVKLSKGLIKVDAEKESVYPTAVFPLMFPGMILFLRGIIDFSIDDYSNIWLPAILISVIFVGVIIALSKKKTVKKAKDYFEIVSYVVFGFIYGYSTVVATNCVFDNSKPEIFASEVLSKSISGGSKGKFYNLNLSSWGKNKEAKKITVESDLYNNVQVGDEVSVYRFKGRFDIPWVVVDYPN
ncbi:hypothetical protein IRZ83_05920 [Flavobacterium sp. JLP]|uniref:hypothetical protein n=1 Tax=Flavobacterium sp. JLP TaxID=2783793 RepID=UPI00188B7EA0|nr:hypothetical protein [Flavobacterium sp. JLP]MBF4506201.1 hypothetical protein [Flavobacterium sp. JLP]